MEVGDVIALELTGMAYGGEAFGRSEEGMMIFVPFALPGERVEVELREIHKRWGRARLHKLVTPSPERTKPRCGHFQTCGGCHYQHLNYERQVQVKSDILVDQLQRIGGIRDPAMGAPVQSPAPWNYRNRLRFHVTTQGELAFYSHDEKDLMPVRECHLPQPEIDQVWPQMEIEPGSNVREVELRTDRHGHAQVVLHGVGGPDFHLDLDRSASVVWLEESATVVLAGDAPTWMEVHGRSFRISPGAFFQTHSELTGALVDLVMEVASLEAGMEVFDLYAGVGLFSAFMAARGAGITAVEASPAACADFEVNLDAFNEIRLYQASVEHALPALETRPHVVVADPPRSGLGRVAVDGLLHMAPERFVYVSCDPATLARDGKRLEAGGYKLRRITLIDLFPQTFHIESVSLWSADS